MEQAKNRNRKIDITDMAIDKIRSVTIPGFSDVQDSILHEAHKTVLSVSQKHNNSDEVVLAYNLHAEERVVVFGDTYHVDIDTDSRMRVLQRKSNAYELVLVHNHPSTANFSLADIDYFIANDYIVLMSVVTNQGDVYALLKTGQYDYDTVRSIELALVRKYSLNEQETIVKMFLKLCSKGGMVYVKGK